MVQAGVRCTEEDQRKARPTELGKGGGDEVGSTRARANMGRATEGGPVKNLAPVEVSVCHTPISMQWGLFEDPNCKLNRADRAKERKL